MPRHQFGGGEVGEARCGHGIGVVDAGMDDGAGVDVPGAGGVDGGGRTRLGALLVAAFHRKASFGAQGDVHVRRDVGEFLGGDVQPIRARPCQGFFGVAEELLDAVAEHRLERVAAVLHHRRIGQRQAGADAGLFAELAGEHGRRATALARRQIALDVQVRGLRERGFIDVLRREVRGNAEAGRHGAFRVRRHQRQAASGAASRGPVAGGGNAGAVEFVQEVPAGVVFGHTARVEALAAEGMGGEHGVRRRAAGHARARFAGGFETRLDGRHARLVQQGHVPLGDAFLLQEGVVDGIFRIDQGIADAVEGVLHGVDAASSPKTSSAAASVCSTTPASWAPETNAVSKADGAK